MGATQQVLASYGGFVGPLDDYEAGLLGYWSVARRVVTSYTGNLILLRRDSDNAEQAFGPAADGYLDVAAITSWLAGANGYVARLYDQIGSNDWIEATAGTQPLFVSALSEFNNRPCLYLDASGGMTCALNVTTPYSLAFTECNPDAATTPGSRTIDGASGNKYISSSRNNAGQFYDQAAGGLLAPVLNSAAAVVEILTATNAAQYHCYSNAVDVTSGTPQSYDWGTLAFARRGVNNEPGRSNVVEVGVFNSQLSAGQVTALQTILNPATL